MFIIKSGWLKIYLFYGMIFFLLGIFGIVLNHEQYWLDWSKNQISQIKNLVRSFISTDGEEAIPVFAERSPEIYLLSRFHNEFSPQADLIRREVTTAFQTKFRKIITIPIDNLRQLNEQTQVYSEQVVSWVFVGVDISVVRPNLLQYQLSLAAPSDTITDITTDLFQRLSGQIPSLTLNKSILKSGDFIEIHWQGAQSGHPDQTAILSDLLKTIAWDYIRKSSVPRLDSGDNMIKF